MMACAMCGAIWSNTAISIITRGIFSEALAEEEAMGDTLRSGRSLRADRS